jgi:hypothetical protein
MSDHVIMPTRRGLIGGLAAGSVAAAAAAQPASIIKAKMPLLARHEGTWAGTYTFITPEMKVNDRYDFRINVKFPDDGKGGITYRQESFYTWPDGRTQELVFEAEYAGGRMITFGGRIAGWMTEVDDRTIYLNFWFADQPGVDVCEMIQLAPNNRDRGRTWHWYKDGKLFQITLVNEYRVA